MKYKYNITYNVFKFIDSNTTLDLDEVWKIRMREVFHQRERESFPSEKISSNVFLNVILRREFKHDASSRLTSLVQSYS